MTLKPARRLEITDAEREALRAAICARFAHPIWSDARDDEIGHMHGVPAETVRELRAEWRRDVGVGKLIALAHELSAQIGWPGTDAELIEHLIRHAMDRAEVRGGAHPLSGLLEALREKKRLEAFEELGARRAAE
jgi:hypothetical protein